MAFPRETDLLRLSSSPSNIRRAPSKKEKSPHVMDSKTVLDSGVHAVDTGFEVVDSTLFQWNLYSGLLQLYFGFQSPVFRIPHAKISPIPESGSRREGVLPYKGLMGKCGQPGYVFRNFCLKQGIDFIIFCLKQGIDFIIFYLKQGIDFIIFLS